uniref:hypothetical protein n=1 Tax=Halorubrum californiense TaxID=416585 RepID=UPI001269674E|nr:hypothetical protein [Halorubrum californiense]
MFIGSDICGSINTQSNTYFRRAKTTAYSIRLIPVTSAAMLNGATKEALNRILLTSVVAVLTRVIIAIPIPRKSIG